MIIKIEYTYIVYYGSHTKQKYRTK